MIYFLSKISRQKLQGTALLRLDFNTEDEWRMKATIPTIGLLLKKTDKVVILSHRGRPLLPKIRKGEPVDFERGLSLKKDASRLENLLRKKVVFIPHFRFAEIKKRIDRAPKKSIFLLENLRFLAGEEKNDRNLAKKIAALGDFYVNDAFAVSHRANASIVAITEFLPSYAGLELEKEIKSLSKVMKYPRKPLIVILGGGKAHDKLGVVNYFKDKARWFLFGGAAANTLLFLKGLDMGKSLVDKDADDLQKLRSILGYKNIILPVDWLSEKGFILDIGQETQKVFVGKIKTARTVIWSGPIGFIEKKRFATGTLKVARAISSNEKAFSVAGGGETVMFLKKHRLDKRFNFISTGGGAMLDFLAGEKLPGIAALAEK